LKLAFDHAAILGDVVKRLRGKLDYTNIALELLPQFFPRRQAQEVDEAILGRKLTKPAFRRKLLDRNIIKATGQREAASAQPSFTLASEEGVAKCVSLKIRRRYPTSC
jgi:8-oxo-dGTP diphosphatase